MVGNHRDGDLRCLGVDRAALPSCAGVAIPSPSGSKRHHRRLVIGSSAVIIGVVGIWHLTRTSPTPSDGAAAMNSAGGVVDGSRRLLVAAVGIDRHRVVLAIVLAFGLSVVTGTSVQALRAT